VPGARSVPGTAFSRAACRGKSPSAANRHVMGFTATLTLLADAISSAQSFVWVFATVYTLVIFVYILTSWVRLPYSPWLNRIQRFLHDVCEPYLRLFRRILPSMGPVDLSPIIAVVVLGVLAKVLISILGRFH
jgi:YggT family protein